MWYVEPSCDGRMRTLGVSLTYPLTAFTSWARARQRALARALPDALDVLVICLRAGLGFHAAIAEYVRSAQGAAADALFTGICRTCPWGRP